MNTQRRTPWALTIAAPGVVFGDIGTSPRYAMQAVFAVGGGAVRPDDLGVFGIVSLIFWAVTLIVTVKYIGLVLQADHDGEGGIMALSALLRSKLPQRGRRRATVLLLGVVGASLFYGDCVITPAISVMSAIEGISVIAPALALMGAEALYADMGHFGPGPIRLGWFFLAFPALVLHHLGQGALVLRDPAAIDNPFFRLATGWLQLPLVVLATAATVIASQVVISGAFSVTRQAAGLGYLPRLTVVQTSQHERGQIYLPMVNWLLFAGVMALLLIFRSSAGLATAFGLAVTGTLCLTTALFLTYLRVVRRWPWWAIVALGVVLATIEVPFLVANALKVATGGWIPLVVAAVVATVMVTWRDGMRVVRRRRMDLTGDWAFALRKLQGMHLTTVPGTAVYLYLNPRTSPLALASNVRFNKVVHEHIVIARVGYVPRPRVSDEQRVVVEHVSDEPDITVVTMRFGFTEDLDVPAAIELARVQGLDVDEEPRYFASHLDLQLGDGKELAAWRKHPFLSLFRNQPRATQAFHLPTAQSVTIEAELKL